MNYRQAKKIKPTDTLLIKGPHFQETTVLSVERDDDAKAVFFHCTDGCFHHTAVNPALSTSIDLQAKRYLRSPNTRVFINHNDELGEWLFSIEVRGSGGFWLDSFPSQEEAESYIQEHNLKMA